MCHLVNVFFLAHPSLSGRLCDGRFWKVQLDVRDLGAGVGALLLGFQVKLGLVRGKFFPAGVHAAEASHVSSSSLSAFKAAIVSAVRSSTMPLGNTPDGT